MYKKLMITSIKCFLRSIKTPQITSQFYQSKCTRIIFSKTIFDNACSSQMTPIDWRIILSFVNIIYSSGYPGFMSFMVQLNSWTHLIEYINKSLEILNMLGLHHQIPRHHSILTGYNK